MVLGQIDVMEGHVARRREIAGAVDVMVLDQERAGARRGDR